MDNFRWILLAVGIFFIVVIYLLSRKSKRDFYHDDHLSEDLPKISTSNWDDLDEGVGEVRIIARANDDDVLNAEPEPGNVYLDKQAEQQGESHKADEYQAKTDRQAEPGQQAEVEAGSEASAEPSETVLVFNILAREGATLSGDSINSVARANDMIFGDMNIYHRVDENNKSLFSLVNMVKPGSFDPANIHELNTPGITLFMQLPGPPKAGDAFNDMLYTAQRLSETLQARLCDGSRQPLTESAVLEYRKIAAAFDGND